MGRPAPESDSVLGGQRRRIAIPCGSDRRPCDCDPPALR